MNNEHISIHINISTYDRDALRDKFVADILILVIIHTIFRAMYPLSWKIIETSMIG